jgi:adhesin transport system outer membrane protein
MLRRIGVLGTALAFGAALAVPAQAESLTSAVRSAVTDNPQARVRSADVQATALDLLGRERDFLPTVTATAEVGAYYYNDPARLAPANNNRVTAGARANVEARYVIFDGFRRANAVYRDAAKVDGSIFRLLDASETLSLNAVEAYIDVLRHRNLAAVARQNILKHQEIGAQVLDLVDGGRLPASDRFEVDQRLVSAKLVAVEVQQALADAEVRYEAVVGHPPNGPMSLPGVRSLPLTREAFVVRATKQSHRVKAADAVVQQRRYDEEIVRSGTLPQVSARTGANAGLNQNGVPGRSVDAYVALGAEWEVFSGGRKAQQRAATMRTVQAMAERDRAVLDLRELAGTTWNAYSANIERTVLLDRQLSATRRTADQYLTQFQAGTRSLIEVLDAEAAWFNARFEDVSAEASYAFNQYQILAVESRLASHFGVRRADVPLMPDFERRAVENGPFSVFSTDIPALK